MKRLPFRISSAPEIFMRIVSGVLEGIDGVVCYFDNILCHSKSPEDHEKLLELVHKRLKDASLQLNTAKCEYKKSEITFLGHIVSAEGCRPDPMKIKAIQGLPEPSDVSALRHYLGMVNYLGKYLSHLSTILRPLHELLSKDTAWMWGPPQRTAFNKVKKLLIKPPVWLTSTQRSRRSWKLIAHPMGLEVVSYKNMRRDLDLSPFALGHYPTQSSVTLRSRRNVLPQYGPVSVLTDISWA